VTLNKNTVNLAGKNQTSSGAVIRWKAADSCRTVYHVTLNSIKFGGKNLGSVRVAL
jgi:hypothetical protein